MLIFLPGEVLRVRFVLVLIGCQCASYRRDDSFRCFSNSTAPKKNYFPLSLLVKYVPLIKVFFKGVKYLKMLKKRERVSFLCGVACLHRMPLPCLSVRTQDPTIHHPKACHPANCSCILSRFSKL